MYKRKIKLIFLIALAVIILVTMLSPLRRSAEHIRENMLKLTPIGMSMEDVIRTIEGNDKWEIVYINYEYGYSITGKPTVGEKSIQVLIGKYKTAFLIDTYVTVFWGFDENTQLVDIYVDKDLNLL